MDHLTHRGNGTPEELWSSCDGVRLQLRLALSLGLLVSYATLARPFAPRKISVDQVTQGGSRGPLSLRASAESGNLNSVGGLGAILANLNRYGWFWDR